MLAEILIFLLLGLMAGTVTGLIPGIHINLVGVSIIALSASLLSSINPVYLVVFIASMAITHTFVDFIPSIFLGCPDTDTELSVLPGHELLKKGRGYEAVLLATYGGLAAIFILILIAFPFKIIIGQFYNFLTLKYVMPIILSIVAVTLIFLEKRKISAFFAFSLAGILGLSVLNLDIKEPFLPLLTGLFGASMLLISIKTKTKIPKQKIEKIHEDIKKPLAGAFLGSVIASPLLSLLPGLGSGQAAIIGNIISRTDRRGFLVLLGATNTLVMGFSFVAFYLVSRTRTGAAVAISEIIGNFSWQILVLILSVIVVTGIISFFLTEFIARFLSQKINQINYTKLSILTLAMLGLLVLFVSGFFGVVVLIVSALTGIYCISLGVRRTQMMGCLLLPTIIFYLTL